MQKEYMKPSDPQAFKDMPVRERSTYFGDGDLCPVCKGHGGWHLELDAYGKDKHFDSSCGACWGYGYLQRGQTCAHEWVAVKSLGNCMHMWACTKCGEERMVDSSD